MSISAGSLRVGNYVYNNNGEVSQVSLLGVGLVMVDKSSKVIEKNCKPIELTDEILENFGFIKVSLNSQFYVHPIVPLFKVTINDELGVMIAWDNHYLKSVKIKYAHELQNIFHVLSSGNELTLSEPF